MCTVQAVRRNWGHLGDEHESAAMRFSLRPGRCGVKRPVRLAHEIEQRNTRLIGHETRRTSLKNSPAAFRSGLWVRPLPERPTRNTLSA